jgi:hypothetical protein
MTNSQNADEARSEIYSTSNEPITLDDVISLQDGQVKTYLSHDTFRVREFLEKLKSQLAHKYEQGGKTNYRHDVTLWFGSGVPCEILPVNGQWQSGKIRMQIVFEPDEVSAEQSVATASEESDDSRQASPLDEIRQDIQG